MLLPHGYDGQGAEHSSCRVERYLQMMEEDPHNVPDMAFDTGTQIQKTNWQIVNCTTPANYFHCLRRQVHRDFRKPLIVVAPKNLLRHKRCVSTLEDMGPGTKFERAFDETDEEISSNPDGVKVRDFRFSLTSRRTKPLTTAIADASVLHWANLLRIVGGTREPRPN